MDTAINILLISSNTLDGNRFSPRMFDEEKIVWQKNVWLQKEGRK